MSVDRNRRGEDRQAFALAKDYLLGLDPRITPKMLARYFVPDKQPETLSHIYQRALESAQNANMKSGVIKGGIGSVEALRPVLCGFTPSAVLRKFKGWRQLLREIVVKLKPKGKIRRRPNSIWPQYCETVLSAAHFFERFDSADDFYAWANMFDCHERARPALPLILQMNVKGFGFALACDFIKELGYANYGKPDVQLTKTFMALGLSENEDL